MKINKKTAILMGIMAFILLVTPSLKAATQQVLMRTIPVWGPPTNNPSYDAWASNTVKEIYQTGEFGTNEGSYLETSYVIQSPALTNYTLWFASHIMSVSSNYMFSPNGLTFAETSSDTNHVFANSFAYTNPAFIFTTRAVGRIWNAGIPRINDSIVTGSWTNKVHEFVFIGNQSPYFTCSTPGQSNAVSVYLDSQTNMMVTGAFTLNDGSGVNPTVTAKKTYYRTHIGDPLPAMPIWLDSVTSSNQMVRISAVGINPGDTWTIQESPPLYPPVWRNVATANTGWSIDVPSTNNVTDFFRAFLY